MFPADILGQVYEQFLGKVIRLTPKHQAVIEDKPEVKKAGGVYYTPTYIVNYIVEQTVGKLLEGKTPKQAAELRILDPACGSGSFLIAAYQKLLDWHQKAYFDDGPEKHAKGKEPKLYLAAGGVWRLTMSERKRILLANIYGVDIDAQAVEVTKLSLLLKALEGETQESVQSQLHLALASGRVLPDLDANIQCGNSLIGPDFYTDKAPVLFDEDEMYRVNAFNWKKQFANVYSIKTAGGAITVGATEGFDAVIGNPPYVRQETLGEQKDYFQKHYEVFNRSADLYVYFIEKGLNLLKENGLFGIIVANKWLRASYGGALRRWLKNKQIREIIDFGDLPVFQTATTYPCILQAARKPAGDSAYVTQIPTLDFADLAEYVAQNRQAINPQELNDEGWSLESHVEQKLLAKLRSSGVPLEKYAEEKIYRGIITGLNEAFVIDAPTRARLITEDPASAEFIRPFVIGRNVKRYYSPAIEQYVILIPRGFTNDNGGKRDPENWFRENMAYPAIAKHLLPFYEAAEKRSDKGDYWWELRACSYYSEFGSAKLVYPNICKRPEFTFDTTGYYTNQKCFIISNADKYLLGILNSSIANFLFRMILPKLRGGFYEPSYVYFKDFPIRPIDFEKAADKQAHDRMVTLVETMLALHQQLPGAAPTTRTVLQRQIESTDRQIDALVYELYGLTPEDIDLVEQNAS